MKKVLLIISIILILILLFISQIIKQEKIRGKIISISYNNNIIIINLENNQTPIIIFTSQLLNIKKGENITAFGNFENYKNQPQFIADKIISHQTK